MSVTSVDLVTGPSLKARTGQVTVRCELGEPDPTEKEPANVDAPVNADRESLASSPIPRLLTVGGPGLILTEGGDELAIALVWPNQEEITVPGVHFLPEDSPDEIGRALRDFVERVRG